MTPDATPPAAPARGAAPGKLGAEEFERRIAPFLGAERAEVLLGPRPGTDAAVVRAGAGRVLAVTTDPLSLIPALGPEKSARLACHLVASDAWTTGIPPAYAAVTLSLPPALEDGTLDRYLAGMHEAWSELNVAVVTGHTGRYAGCDLTIVGAATAIGIGDEGRWIGAPFVEPGDRVLMTKDVAFEATAIAAHLVPKRFERALAQLGAERPAAALEAAREQLERVSVAADCRAALRVGVRDRGVSALHDATEGGVVGGLIELARSTGHDLRVERARIPISLAARAAAQAMEFDPYVALSEGTLLACVRAPYVAPVIAALAEDGIVSAEIGEVVRGRGSLWLTEGDARVHTLTDAPDDPWWDAYARAVREGWE